MRLDLGSPVTCSDGGFGELADIVIDPSARHVTHLVVQPHHRHDRARLVPLDRARPEGPTQGVALDYTAAEVAELRPVHKAAYVRLGHRPEGEAGTDVGIEDDLLLLSYESLGNTGLGVGIEPIDLDPHMTVSYDLVPKDTVELRRESAVTSSDGHHLGHVVGVVLDGSGQIAEVVLEHGHLWGKREIAIADASIDHIVSDEVVLTLSKDEVGR